MGTSTQPVYITDSYDAQTRRLTEQKTQTGTAQATIDDLHYGYDNAGNVTSEADTPAAGPADVQCFQYDYLGRLVQAWAQGSTGCATTPSATAEGGAAPYWNAYTYNTVGNLTGITATAPTGAVTTTTDGYPAAGAARPHAITTSQVTTSSGSTNSSYGYDASGHLSTITEHCPERGADLERRRATGADRDHPVRRFGQEHQLRLRRRRDPAARRRPRHHHAVPARRGTVPEYRHRHGHRHPLLQPRRRHRRRPHRRLRPGLPGRRPAGHRLGRHRLGHPRRHPPLLRPLRQPPGHHAAQLPGRREGLRRRRRRHRHRPDRPRRPRIPARHRLVHLPRPAAQALRPAEPQRLRLRRRQPLHLLRPLRRDALRPRRQMRQRQGPQQLRQGANRRRQPQAQGLQPVPQRLPAHRAGLRRSRTLDEGRQHQLPEARLGQASPRYQATDDQKPATVLLRPHVHPRRNLHQHRRRRIRDMELRKEPLGRYRYRNRYNWFCPMRHRTKGRRSHHMRSRRRRRSACDVADGARGCGAEG